MQIFSLAAFAKVIALTVTMEIFPNKPLGAVHLGIPFPPFFLILLQVSLLLLAFSRDRREYAYTGQPLAHKLGTMKQEFNRIF